MTAFGRRLAAEETTGQLSSVFSYLVLAGGFLTIAVTLYMVVTTYSSLPYWDGWTQVEIAAKGISPISPAWLWQQHNEHRLVLPKLFLAADLYFFRARQALLLTSIFLTQLAQVTLLCWSMHVIGGWSGALWRTGAGLIAFCLFCPSQFENFVWGFQICYVLPLFFSSLSFTCFVLYATGSQSQEKRPWAWLLALSLIAAVAASYSLANGNLVWPLLIVAALFLRVRIRTVLLFTAVGAANIGLYLHNYARPAIHADPLTSLQSPLSIFKYCANYFFSALPLGGGPEFALLILAFLLLLIPALLYVRTFRVFATQLILVALYCCATALITALGRLNFGLAQAAAPRYQSTALLMWCAVGLLWLGGAYAARTKIPQLFAVVQVVALTFLIVGAILARHPLGAAREHSSSQNVAAAALLSGVSDSVALGDVMPPGLEFEKVIPYMVSKRLSVFSQDAASNLGRPLASAFSVIDNNRCVGSVESVSPVSSSFGSALAPGRRIIGWVKLTNHKDESRGPSSIVVSANGTMAGVGAVGQWLPHFQGRPQESGPVSVMRQDGFVAFVPQSAGNRSISLYVVLNGSSKDACYIGAVPQ